MTQKDYLIKTTFDNAGLTAAQVDFKNTQMAAKALGIEMADTAKIIDTKVTTSLNALGGVMRRVATTVQQDGKNIRVAFTDAQGGITNVTGAMNSASVSTETFAGKIGELASRALPTMLVWEAFRAVIKGVEDVISESIKFLVDWEVEMAKVRAVTGATKDQIDELSHSLLQVSERYAIANHEVATSANEWLRMGANLQTVAPLLEATAKLSKLSGESMSDSALTVNKMMSGFNLNADQMAGAIDKLVSIEEGSGVPLEVMAAALGKAGEKAKEAHVSFDQLAGYIAAVNQKTHESGELIGSQLTVLLTRLGKTSSDTAQNISGVPFYLDKLGQATMTHTPVLRDMNTILSELSVKWNTLTNSQQNYLSMALGGALRTKTGIALMENFNETIKATSEETDAAGKAQEALNKQTDNVKDKVTQLQTNWAGFLTTVGNTSMIKGAVQGLNEFIISLTQVTKLVEHPIKFLFTRHPLVDPKTGLDIPGKNDDWSGSSGKYNDDKKKMDEKSTAQQTVNTDILTEVQLKGKIQDIEDKAIITRQDKIAMYKEELDLLGEGITADGKNESALIASITHKKEEAELQRQITLANENQLVVEAQMKEEGASQLQIDIQHLGYLKATNATIEEQAKQQAKVDMDTLTEHKQIQDAIITAILGQQKAMGDNALVQLQEKIALQEKLGIHLQGIDLLKQQLALYQAISAETQKTPAQRRKELMQLAEKQPRPGMHMTNGFQESQQESRAENFARGRGIDQKTIDAILHPEKVGGGENSLQSQLKAALGTPTEHLTTAIEKLTEFLEKEAQAPISSKAPAPGSVVTESQMWMHPGPKNYSGTLSDTNSGNTAKGDRHVTVTIGDLHFGVTHQKGKDLADEVKKEITELIAAHLLKPGTKISDALVKGMDSF